MQITVYTQPNCIYCENLVSFLEEKKVNYKEINIHKSIEVYEEFSQLGGRATPYIIKKINNKIVSKIIGFNKKEIIIELNIS